VQRRKPESSEATAARQRLFRERERGTVRWLTATCQSGLPLAEAKDRIVAWESATGQNWLASKVLGLNALDRIGPWRYPLVPSHKDRTGEPWSRVDRTGEPWGVLLGKQLHWEHYWEREEDVALGSLGIAEWYREVVGKDRSAYYGSLSSPESGSGAVFIPPSGNSKPISVLSSIGDNQNPTLFKWTKSAAKSWLQLNPSATKRSKHYAANFRFT
jgi:hypothetical protein